VRPGDRAEARRRDVRADGISVLAVGDERLSRSDAGDAAIASAIQPS
jgi:hypothetical protein